MISLVITHNAIIIKISITTEIKITTEFLLFKIP